MAFDKKVLSRFGSVAPAANSTISFFLYASNDAKSAIVADGYFNDAREQLQKSDLIIAVCDLDGTPDMTILRTTAVPASGNVTVATAEVQDVVGDQTHIAGLTDSSGGTADGTVNAVSGSGADPAINKNFAELATKVNAIIAALEASGHNATS